MTDADRPVLICYDGSDGARRAIAVAGGLVPARRAIVIDVGPAHERYSGLYSGAEPHAAPDNVEVALDRAQAGAEVARRAGFDAVPSSETVSQDWKGIAGYADEVDAALIVIASDWRGGAAYEVAAHGGRPVLAVPPARG
jgi:nucleotide-binding universal stress UspA family protein